MPAEHAGEATVVYAAAALHLAARGATVDLTESGRERVAALADAVRRVSGA